MASLAELNLSLDVIDADGNRPLSRTVRARWSPTVLKMESVTLAAGFNALSPPTGAQAVLIVPAAAAVSLTLKGVTGDQGTAILPASTPKGIPLLLPLGGSPSIGLTNGGSETSAVIYWL